MAQCKIIKSNRGWRMANDPMWGRNIVCGGCIDAATLLALSSNNIRALVGITPTIHCITMHYFFWLGLYSIVSNDKDRPHYTRGQWKRIMIHVFIARLFILLSTTKDIGWYIVVFSLFCLFFLLRSLCSHPVCLVTTFNVFMPQLLAGDGRSQRQQSSVSMFTPIV